MARILQEQMKGLVIILLSCLVVACSPVTTVMIIETLDGTKYVKCARMNSTELYFIKLKGAKENELKEVKIKKLKQKKKL